jgi:hypothetical protein
MAIATLQRYNVETLKGVALRARDIYLAPTAQYSLVAWGSALGE